jgi:hypothetical protein
MPKIQLAAGAASMGPAVGVAAFGSGQPTTH